MIDNEKAMKLLQFADNVDFSGNEMTIKSKLKVSGNITADSGVTLSEGTILSNPSASNIILRDDNTNLEMEMASKQDTLVSGTNIKTINGNSLLGSGDMTISGGGSTYTAGDGITINNSAISIDYNSEHFAIANNKLKLNSALTWIEGANSALGATPNYFGSWIVMFTNDESAYASTNHIELRCNVITATDISSFSTTIVNYYNALFSTAYQDLSEVMTALNVVWTAQAAQRQNLAKLLLCLANYYFTSDKEIRHANGTTKEVYKTITSAFDTNSMAGDLYYIDVDEGSSLVIESLSNIAKEYSKVFCFQVD